MLRHLAGCSSHSRSGTAVRLLHCPRCARTGRSRALAVPLLLQGRWRCRRARASGPVCAPRPARDACSGAARVHALAQRSKGVMPFMRRRRAGPRRARQATPARFNSGPAVNNAGETRATVVHSASRTAHSEEAGVCALPSREDRSRNGAFGLFSRACVLRSRRRAQVVRRRRLPAAAKCARIAAPLVVCLLLAGSAIATPVSTASAGRPVARAVLFYSPACQHCRDLIRGYLPSLMDEYGSRLQILSVNAADPAGRKLFQAAVTKFDVPVRDRGVPAVVILSLIHI